MKHKAKKEVGKRPTAKLTEFFQSTSTSSKGGTPGECEMWNESGSRPFVKIPSPLFQISDPCL
jgi:hypothetical protein